MFEVNKKTIFRLFLGAALCIVLYWLLNERESVKVVCSAALNVLSPFITGGCIAFIANVPMRFFENKLSKIKAPGLKRTIALILTFIAVALVLGVVFLLLIPQLIETIETFIPAVYDFMQEVGVYVNEALSENPDAMGLLEGSGNGAMLDISALVQKVVGWLGDRVSTILQGAVSILSRVAGFAMDLFVAIVFAVYCLFQKETLARQGRKILYAFLKEKNADRIIHILRLSNSTFSNFLSGQCIEVCILGVMIAISMAILKMPYIPLVSVLVAVTAFIPIVGAWVGCVVGVFFMLVNDPMQAVWFFVMFLVVQQIEGNLIYPKVVGGSVGLPAMWTLLAVVVGGSVSGIFGIIVFIPLFSVIYALVRRNVYSRLRKKKIKIEE